MLISIVIPCYNVEQYIEECIRSCYAQSYSNIEVIAVDNNSTDKTLYKLKELQFSYPELIILQEKIPGAPAARNKGMHVAKGEWIQFLDADDLLKPNKIEHQVTLIQRDASFMATAYLKRPLKGNESEVYFNPKDIIKGLFNTNLGITSSNLWNKRFLIEVNGWNESLKSSQEANLMFRLLQINENIIIDSEPLTIVQERESGQISQGNPVKKWTQYIKLRLEIIDWLKNEQLEYFNRNKNYFYSILLTNIRNIAAHNLPLAVSLIKNHIPRYFFPSTINGHLSIYSFLYFLFGFKFTEKLYKTLRKA
ncbi:glycosyltransferase family 2 protein [Carboxylicivirga mesophila]|uniref:Glycosyltransferase family 2 protein n=1 Tax=Carboxylicivirga mesophila TaxID=1166478 RepID=A0ABS5KAX0_9BACT|nr:glycosyltransferase family A protein [Carboxylicivirga mesophila]MBS2212125.1 glycosyltransferase family 2 protein [Carboxylicivirga mesophila]